MTLGSHAAFDAPGRRPRVLVVDDDDAAVRETLELVLGCRGLDVITAADGRTAVELVRGVDVDLVLTDLQMGEMDGIAMLRELRAVKPETPVVVLTGYASEEAQAELERCGATAVCLKPLSLAELYGAIGRALHH